MVEVACQSITNEMVAEYSHGNANSLQQVMDDPDIEVREFPAEVLQHLKEITREVVEEMMANDPASEKIGKAFYAYLEKQEPNSRVTDQAFLATRDA